MRFLAVLFGLVLAMDALPALPPDAVRILTGPTPIPGGDALGPRDITVTNGRLAMSFAVDTAAPWGVPRGGVLDLAGITDGVIGPDRISLLDFLPDSWSKWIDAQPRITAEREGERAVTVRVERAWQGVTITTTYRLDAGDSVIHAVTRMENSGEATHRGILSGYVLWPDGGHLFGLPGMAGAQEGTTERALASWSAAYDESWVLALHAPYADRMQDEGRDRYLRHDLGPGEARTFEAWAQLEPGGSLAPVVARDIGLSQRPSGRISGRVVAADGAPVAVPAIVVEQEVDGRPVPYAWALGQDGRYELELPAGQYSVYATAKNHSASASRPLDLSADEHAEVDFAELGPPGELRVAVRDASSGRPLDARLAIEQGVKPLIGYFGKATFFTRLDAPGELAVALAPGQYRFRVSSGENFTAKPALLEVALAPGERHAVAVELSVLAEPSARGWYSGDMHHHSDVLDGFTEPEFVLRSQLAAGLDVTLLSDHDSVVNNRDMQRLAAARGVPFIAGTEFSPSWAHFNAYPLDEAARIGIDPGTATVQAIFAEARRMGADVIAVNHPYQSYGYFHTDETGDIPGGYSDKFDLVEITAGDLAANSPTLRRTWRLWNEGRRFYLAAGSDAHDVWQEVSGSARMMVRVDDGLSVARFIGALKRGHAYATTGPLVWPEHLFGETLTHPAGAPLALRYEVQAINGLANVRLIEQGRETDSRHFEFTDAPIPVEFVVVPAADTWYGLVVEDAAGKFLVSNPLWIRVNGTAPPARD